MFQDFEDGKKPDEEGRGRMGLSLAVMAALGSIQAAWHVSLLLGAGLGLPLWMRWLWRRASVWSELSALVVSAMAAPWLLALVETEAVRLLTMAALGATAATLAALMGPREDPARLDAFYERVRPPGFWGEAEARVRLGRGLVGTAAAAVSLFAGLVAGVTMLVGAPAPPGLGRGLWLALLVAAAVLAMPIWLRGLSEREES